MKLKISHFFLFNILFYFINLKADVVVFTKQDSSDWTLPENQDRIADSVWITRKNNQSIFNIALEDGFSSSNGSPFGTLWARSSTADASNEDFTSFIAMHGQNPQSLINDTISLYLIEYGQYFDLVFLSYSGGQTGGGFSYLREEVFPNHLGLESEMIQLKQISLGDNYPNPFNPITTIHYELPKNHLVNITVYDLLGNVVTNLININQSPGYKSIQWNAANNLGKPLPAGVYLYRLEVGDFSQTKKMILLK